jgi:hypothetical protein
MKDDVRKALKGVEFLYHATRNENMDSIGKKGLKPGMDGNVYLCTKDHHAAGFGVLYGMGARYPVIEVSVRMLDEDKLGMSCDHNPDFFPEGMVAITYRGTISPGAFLFNAITYYEGKHDFKKIMEENPGT